MSAAIETGVLVIGGGIVGVSTAYHLARKGAPVILLERDRVGSKASGVNFGGLRTNGREAAELPLSLRAMEFWRSIKGHLGNDCEAQFPGHLEVTNEEDKMAVMERWAGSARDYGVQAELLSGPEILRRWPWLNPQVIGGCFVATDGNANPRLVTPYLARAAAALGADIREQVEIVEVGHDGRKFRVACSDGRTFAADRLVNAAGAWGGRLAEGFGDATPWQTMAPQMVVSEPLPFRIDIVVDCNVGGRYLYARQIERGNVLFGRGPGRFDLDAGRAFVVPQNPMNAANIAIGLIPHLRNGHIIRTWSGLEGKFPDSLPVIDMSPSVAGLIHGFGFSGHGFQLGPASGAVIAELASGGASQTDISGFAIGRFGRPGREGA